MKTTLSFYRGDEKLYAEIDFNAPPVEIKEVTIFDGNGKQLHSVEISEKLEAMFIEQCWKEWDDLNWRVK